MKSGEKQPSQKNISATAVSLINTAKNDLKTRLTSTNDSLWLNAVNHARIALNEVSDEKKRFAKFLKIMEMTLQQEYIIVMTRM